jgi:ABC-type sugar transport system ATPase subunit
MSTIEFKSLGKRFGTQPVLRDIDLRIEEGEFVVLVGPSGCGKTTLLRILAGLESTSSGQVLINGQDMSDTLPSERGLAMVFQSYALYPHMTVQENLSFGLRMRSTPPAVIRERVEQAVNILKLHDLLQRRPGELSGGQCQRVAIGRALVQQPGAFLFDEPLSNLDAELRLHLRLELLRLHRDLRATMVCVTHDQIEAMTMADRIVVLRDGAVEQVGTPQELYTAPHNRFVAQFLGSPPMNILPVAEVPIPRFACDPQVPATVTHWGVRPEHLYPCEASDDNALPVRVLHIERVGGSDWLHGIVGDKAHGLCLQTPAGHPVKPGQDLFVRPSKQHVHLFDGQGLRISENP